MFDFGMFKHFLLSACYVLRHVSALKFGHLHAKMRSFRHVSSFRVLLHVGFLHVEALSSVGVLRSWACLILACLILSSVGLLHSATLCRADTTDSVLSTFFSWPAACLGMFDFGMFKYFLLSACCIPHTHIHIHLRPGAGLARGREAGLNCASATLCRADTTDSVLSTFFSWPAACLGMFDFGMFKYFLLSACCIPHTHIHIHLRPGAGLARGREAGLNCASATLCRADTTDSVLSTFFSWPAACLCMFDFGMFKYFLLSACCIPHTHTHTCGQVLVLLVVERQGSTALQQRCAEQTRQILLLACRLFSCRCCSSVLVALAQLEVADNSSSTHTTTTQLQLVSYDVTTTTTQQSS